MYNRDSSAFEKDGSLRMPFFDRLERLLDKALACASAPLLTQHALARFLPCSSPSSH